MKARYSKTHLSNDTLKKIHKIKAIKDELNRTKHNADAYAFTKEKARKLLNSISMKEMEVIGAYLGNSLPNLKDETNDK